MGTPSYHLYVDDSGVRFADRPSTPRKDGLDYFAMGGLLIKAEDVAAMRTQLTELRARHGISAPFHSSSMRSRKKAWSWLGIDQGRAERLMTDLSAFLCSVTGHATACIIHRPGYETRYGHYDQARWHLCKSAYTILVERAAKIALRDERQLVVYVEQTGREEDRAVREYHAALRQDGMVFNPTTSGKYQPLGAGSFSSVLMKNPDFFNKDHLIGQMADLLLYPLVKGRYDASYRPYQELLATGRIIDCALPPEQQELLGVKHFCFDEA